MKKLGKRIDALLAMRAKKRGVTAEALLDMQVQERPDLFEFFRRDARGRTSARNIFLARMKAAQTTDYPGLDCLTPQEVESIAMDEEVPESRLEHVDRCETCRTLLSCTSGTMSDELDEALDHVISFAKSQAVRTDSEQGGRDLGEQYATSYEGRAYPLDERQDLLRYRRQLDEITRKTDSIFDTREYHALLN